MKQYFLSTRYFYSKNDNRTLDFKEIEHNRIKERLPECREACKSECSQVRYYSSKKMYPKNYSLYTLNPNGYINQGNLSD